MPSVHETPLTPSRFPGKMRRQIWVKTLRDNGGKCRRCYHFCYQFCRLFHISASFQNTWRRGESNRCFDDVRPGLSVNVLLEGIREQAERRGLLRMATVVITSLFVAQRILQETTLTLLGQTPPFRYACEVTPPLICGMNLNSNVPLCPIWIGRSAPLLKAFTARSVPRHNSSEEPYS
jgi:hypothetical protein